MKMEKISPTNSTMVEYFQSQCNRYVNGQCSTRACLVRGGYRGSEPVNYDLATCAYHEAVKHLELD